MLQLQSLAGIFVFIAIAFYFSNNRKKIIWKNVAMGLFIQCTLALLVLGIPGLGIQGPLKIIFNIANIGIMKLLNFTTVGSRFVFGSLALKDETGFILAFQVLPIIIFLSSLMTVLYHLGIMQWVVNIFAKLMQKVLNLSGAEALAAAANVFVGQTEAPLVVRPYLKNMTSSELFSLMTGGMATIAGSVMVAYVGLLKDSIEGIAGHLLVASVISAPAALIIAKIMVPETQEPETLGHIPNDNKTEHVNVIEAAASGASEGMKLAANVGAMLLAFVALIAMLDAMFIGFGNLIGFDSWGQIFVPEHQVGLSSPELSITLILSWLFKPIAFFLGIPWHELSIAGSLIGTKVVFNEFLAYQDLAKVASSLSPRTAIILSYALCGFANFSSIAIQIGGIGPLVPERKKELARFGIRSIIGGSLAAFITASIAGILN